MSHSGLSELGSVRLSLSAYLRIEPTCFNVIWKSKLYNLTCVSICLQEHSRLPGINGEMCNIIFHVADIFAIFARILCAHSRSSPTAITRSPLEVVSCACAAARAHRSRCRRDIPKSRVVETKPCTVAPDGRIVSLALPLRSVLLTVCVCVRVFSCACTG